MRPLALLAAALWVGCRSAPAPCPFSSAIAAGGGRWIDLSHDFSSETIYWPTAKPFALEVVSAQRTPQGYYYAANNLSAAEHGGTHLDAPVHFAEGKRTADQIPLTQLIAPAAVIDVRVEARANVDLRIGVAALEEWVRQHGRIEPGTIVLFNTGWDVRWPDRQRYLGTTKTGPAAVAELHFPGIDSSAARWLVEHQTAAVGIDTPSLDYGQSATFDTHRTLFAADIPGFENVASLDSLPATGAFVVALPMKIKGGSGGPLRIVARLPI